MQTALLIISSLALTASLAALIIVLVSRGSIVKETTRDLSNRIDSMQRNTLTALGETIRSSSHLQQQSLDGYGKTVAEMMDRTDKQLLKLRETQDTKLSEMNRTIIERMNEMQRSNDEKLEKMQRSNDEKLEKMQLSNEKRLDQMRETVDQKLQEGLAKNVSESFKLVQTQLENVQRGLGEMQTLASDVGGLKKTLENVKTKGIFGETQLSRILEDILTRDQYEENVITRKGSRDPVEFAVRLPGKKDEEKVLLPIDSKFPNTEYANLLDALDRGDKDDAEAAGKALEQATKKNAKDIHDKYIDPPHTTDFAIMFLPTEGLFAEIVRRTDLIEYLRTEYKVTVAGPSTISAFLNSLQMGFRTLAIEKRSSEVWNVLGAVKTEFGKFESKLEKVQGYFGNAQKGLEDLVGTRTRVMMSKLKKVEQLPDETAAELLGTEEYPEEGDSDYDIS